MRILHVIPGLTRERGGPTTVVRALAAHQAEAGHAVTVLTTDQGLRHGEQRVALHPAVAVEQLRVCGPDRVAFVPGLVPRTRALLRACDVAHVHSVFHVNFSTRGFKASSRHKVGAKIKLRAFRGNKTIKGFKTLRGSFRICP